MQAEARAAGSPVPRCRGVLRRLRRGALAQLGKDQNGTTAIEFGFVALPFFIFVLGIMAVGLQFFTVNALDHSAEAAARMIRTGQAQQAGKTIKDFREMVCPPEGPYFSSDDCSKMKVHVQSGNNWSDASMVPVVCASGGNMTATSGSELDPLTSKSGGASQVVLVTVCFDWDMPIHFPMLNKILMRPSDGIPLASGGALIQSVVTFRTEPYE